VSESSCSLPEDAPAELLLWLALRTLESQSAELEEARASAARWEAEAVLRAATVANALALKAREAECAEKRLRAGLRSLVASAGTDDLSCSCALDRIVRMLEDN
jgi:hypothetical protein